MYDELFQLFEESLDDLDFDQASLILDLVGRLDRPYSVDLRYNVAEIRFNRLIKFDFEKVMTQELFDKVEEMSDRELTGKAIVELAYAPLFAGNLTRVENICTQYETFILELDSLRTKGFFYNVLATLHASQSRFDMAIEAFRTSLEYRLEDGNPHLISQSYNNLGATYTGKGIHDKSIEYCTKATEISHDLLNTSYPVQFHFSTLHTLFEAYLEKGDIEIAKSVVDEMGEIYENDPENSRYQVIYKISLAYLYTTSNSLLDKMKAKEILAKVRTVDIRDVQFSVRAILLYCELALLELETLGTEQVYEEVVGAVNQLRDLVPIRNSLDLEIQANILRSKLHYVYGEVDKGYEMLLATRDLIEINDLSIEKENINKEIQDYERNVSDSNTIKIEGDELKDRIRDARLMKYIENAKKLGL